MTKEEKDMVNINVLVPKEDKDKLLEICKQFDTDLSKFLRKIIKKVIS